jgi:hypothetical protein
MKSLSHIEQQIFDVDGIRASLAGPSGGHEDYWTNRFNGDKTVSDFKNRFSQRYPDVDIIVHDGIGHVAHGNYLIKNLRTTHEFAWIQETVDVYDQFIHDQLEQIELLKKQLEQAVRAADATPEPDPYEILGVDRNSTDEEITQAYRKKIHRFHPDKLSTLDDAIIAFGKERAQMINWARDEISRERSVVDAA